MKIWIYLHGVQQGPYALDELHHFPMTPDTPVWYDGLPDWTPAGQAPATAALFPQQCEDVASESSELSEPSEPSELSEQPVAEQVWAWQQQPTDRPKAPNSYFVWSIILTLICCTPLSIAAIVTGAMTNSRYNAGNYEGARRMSATTEWLVILAIVFGVLALPLTLLTLLWI